MRITILWMIAAIVWAELLLESAFGKAPDRFEIRAIVFLIALSFVIVNAFKLKGTYRWRSQ